jgi:phage terminase Nu1 subunit (DNA packaging protein)
MESETYINRQELAALAGIESSSISHIEHGRYKSAPPLVFPSNGLITVAEAGEWLRAYAISKADRRAPTDAKLESERQLARKNAAIADKTELHNAARRGELIEAEAARAAWAVIVECVTARLLQIPTVAAPLVTGAADQYAIMEQLDDVIRDALTELSAPA